MSFKNKRTFAMAMTLALLLSACQSTPEKQIIVNKADTVYGQGPTEQTAPQSAAIQPYSIIAINAIDGSRVTPEIGLPSAP